MINFTPMARALMMQRVRAARTWRGDGIEKAQRRVLAWLTRRGANVTNISGVPSWFMTVIKEVIK